MIILYQLLALLTGVTLAVMISINGYLAAEFNAFTAAAIIHLVGSAAALILWLSQKERKPLMGHGPWWIYLGGALGVVTTLFQNYAFGHISLTSIVALGLLGQTVTSILIDCFGFFGMEKHPFKKSSLFGLIFAVLGIIMMLDGSVTSAITAVAISLLSGVSVVTSRTVNSRLADKTGALGSSLTAHVTGLVLTVALALIFTGGAPLADIGAGAGKPWIYLGGILGVTVIVLCNVTVPRVSAFRLTLLTFVGQVFSGILIDLLLGRAFANATFTGGLIIATGIGVNMVVEWLMEERKKKRA